MGTPALQEAEVGSRKQGAFFLHLEPAPKGLQLAPPAQPAQQYKSHSLVASNWGAIPTSPQPLRMVAAGEARDIVLHGLLETPLEEGHRSPLEWVASLAIHVAVVAALVIAPLAFTQVIDFQNLRVTYLALPRPPAAAPAPRPPAAAQAHTVRAIQPSAITMPTAIPKKIAQIKDEAAPDINLGVTGGIEGGESGGVLGGILGGIQNGPTPPPSVSAPKKTIYRVGGVVKPPRELLRVAPVYSPIARTAHVEGTVQIDAIIDENGNIVHARAVSGPGLLIASALEAVMKWKYEPTYLDGTPVSIEMQVQVNFHLR